MSCGVKGRRGSVQARARAWMWVWSARNGEGAMLAHQPQVARVLRLQKAQDGQRDRALGDPDDVAHGLAGAVRAARVAVDVAPLHARRQVGAAQLDVVARLGGEPLPRKLELAACDEGRGRWGGGARSRVHVRVWGSSGGKRASSAGRGGSCT
jgi:hypothetical protein